MSEEIGIIFALMEAESFSPLKSYKSASHHEFEC
jgi:hypothetical protein